jgi:hypothetical protein
MPSFYAALVSLWASIIGAAPPADLPETAPKPGIAGPVETRPKPEIERPPEASPVEVKPEVKTTSGLVKCQIDIERGPSYRSIVAIGRAEQAPQSGTFTLEIEKAGRNTTRSRQHGDFALATGETKRLAKVRVSVGANETISGRLLLNAKDSETVCEIK